MIEISFVALGKLNNCTKEMHMTKDCIPTVRPTPVIFREFVQANKIVKAYV